MSFRGCDALERGAVRTVGKSGRLTAHLLHAALKGGILLLFAQVQRRRGMRAAGHAAQRGLQVEQRGGAAGARKSRSGEKASTERVRGTSQAAVCSGSGRCG